VKMQLVGVMPWNENCLRNVQFIDVSYVYYVFKFS
jgi:hypothetical protein